MPGGPRTLDTVWRKRDWGKRLGDGQACAPGVGRRNEGGAAQPQPMGHGGLRGDSRPLSRRAKRSRRPAVGQRRPESEPSLAHLPDPEAWLENVAFPEPADDPALAELEDEDLVLGADELEFDAEQWREASERYVASERGARTRAAETARVRSKRTRALPRQESSRRDPRRVASGTGPTRRIPRASAPISPSVRSRVARSVTTRLRALPPRPAAQPPQARPSQPCWGATVRRPSFRVSRGGLSKAQALAVTWPELEPAEAAPTRSRPPLEVLALAALSLGLLLAIGGPFLLRQERTQPLADQQTTSAAATSASSTRPRAGAPTAATANADPARVTPSPSERGGAEPSRDRSPEASRRDEVRGKERLDPRLRRRGSWALAKREAAEKVLGAVGGARLRFGLSCGTQGGLAFVPLRLEQLADLPPARTLTWELRHDARLKVEAVSAGPAAREAGASAEFEALGPGRVRVTVAGGREIGVGELCVLRLRVPPPDTEAPLPSYLPLEAVALRLDERDPQPGAGARGALRLEP